MPAKKAPKPVVCLDFAVCGELIDDGVMESFDPRPGIKDFLAALKQNNFNIYITNYKNYDFMRAWLDKYDLAKYVTKVVMGRPKATVYLGPRELTFNGNYFESLLQIVNFTPYLEA
jgi:hypothetical protein